MGQCNFCSLKNIRRKASERGEKITIMKDATWGMGGINVYVHPTNIKIENISGGEDGDRAKYRKSWFMELTDHCVC